MQIMQISSANFNKKWDFCTSRVLCEWEWVRDLKGQGRGGDILGTKRLFNDILVR